MSPVEVEGMAVTVEHRSGLSLKAQLAIEHYLVHGDKVMAYATGYGRGKSSKRVFENLARRFFDRPKVVAEVRLRREEISAKTDITVDKILKRLHDFAYTDLPGIALFDGHVMTARDFDQLTPAQRAAIKKFEYLRDPPTEVKDEDGTVRRVEGEAKVKIELEDRLAATIKLGQHIGMWEKKPKQAVLDKPIIVFHGMPTG